MLQHKRMAIAFTEADLLVADSSTKFFEGVGGIAEAEETANIDSVGNFESLFDLNRGEAFHWAAIYSKAFGDNH